ncbi:hypothetical protein NECAME_01077 [Necator americanus]|uniref:Uncharacterized protein n=1 Tax=Necator americanus TaxID=51031 RepID=W2SJN3_NECAM|nr:hypothetical protein NECAME_01077 [Necator americanus]ETN68967.1 hypothetical protein NECAME_01077 [Necator americanus]
MWILPLILVLAAVEAGRYGAPQMAPSNPPSYAPSQQWWPVPFYNPWWGHGHRGWWSSSSGSSERRRRHRHDRYSEEKHEPEAPACTRCPKLNIINYKNDPTMATIHLTAVYKYLLVVQSQGLSLGLGNKAMLECTNMKTWTPIQVSGADIDAVGCVPAEEEVNLKNLKELASKKQKRHVVEEEADQSEPDVHDATVKSTNVSEETEEEEEHELKQVSPEKH